MTQAINTKFNNLEEMLSKTQKVSETAEYGMDKTAKDFKNVFDKTLDKVQEKVADKKVLAKEKVDFAEIKASIKEFKDGKEESDSLSSWSEFKDLLTEISSEANVETSLDLTLAKDINEIITQLKEAVEETTEIIEDSLEIETVVNDSLLLDNEFLTNSEEENVEINSDLNQNDEDLTQKSDVSFEQLVASLNTVFNNSSKEDSSFQEQSVNQEDIELNLEVSQLDSEEVIDLTENLIDETVSSNISENTQELSIDEDIMKDLKIESIRAEVDTSTGENLMQNQTPEEHAVKAMINQEVETFDLKVDSSNQQVQQAGSQVQAKPVDVNPSRIIDQITKHLEGLQNNSKVSIVLNPESLGKVDIQLLTTKEGLSAQFTVATQEARDLLMKGLEGLKETLTSHGVGVDNVSVKVAEGQKSEYKQDWTEQEGSRGGNKGQDQPNREEKEKGLFEKMMAQKNESNNENGNV